MWFSGMSFKEEQSMVLNLFSSYTYFCSKNVIPCKYHWPKQNIVFLHYKIYIDTLYLLKPWFNPLALNFPTIRPSSVEFTTRADIISLQLQLFDPPFDFKCSPCTKILQKRRPREIVETMPKHDIQPTLYICDSIKGTLRSNFGEQYSNDK